MQPINFSYYYIPARSGSPEDVNELLSIAEAEGVYDAKIDRKILKTGREIWTLGGQE